MALRGGRIRKRKRRRLIRTSRNRLQQHQAGYEQGNSIGYVKGWGEGVAAYTAPFDGTSIVIPTFNQLELLKACVESIQTYTPEQHEIIVIDNGSTDGTAEYLHTLVGQIRYKINTDNLGFAGGTNQGFMMARGSTMMMLNNDTVVTRGWLARLLECLRSQTKPALVGPVTNYISGDQLIETKYATMQAMHAFADAYHHEHRGEWRTTGRLTGFCVLFTRESFHRIGFLDEGFVIGNCEDDDFGLRAKLVGHELVIAANTFIHHEGSKTIKTFDRAKFDEIFGSNLAFYSQKWGDPHALLSEVNEYRYGPQTMKEYYPEYVIVQGSGMGQYWIEGGVRHLIEGGDDLQAVRLSQIDLRNWPVGNMVSMEHINRQLGALAIGRNEDGSLIDGALVRTEEGHLFQLKQGILNKIHTELTLREWKLEARTIHLLTNGEANGYQHGRPILAPPRIHASNI